MEHMRRITIGIPLAGDALTLLRKRERQLGEEYPDAPISWTPLENLHITVSVPGYIADAQLPAFIDTLTHRMAQHEPFDLHFSEWVLGPSETQPKMVWLVAQEVSKALGMIKTDIERIMAPMHPVITAYAPRVVLGQIAQKRWRALQEKPVIAHKTSLVIMVENLSVFEIIKIDGKRAFVPLATCDLGAES